MPSKNEFISEIGQCELCGSRRNLELHHSIPMVCEPIETIGKNLIKLDVEDNWVCICSSCHSKLTPKKLLTRIGINKKRLIRRKDFEKYEIWECFCKYIQNVLDEYGSVQSKDYFDAVEYAVFGKDPVSDETDT